MNELKPTTSQSPERTITQVTQEINYITSQAQRLILGHAIEIGRRLTEAKAMLPHGAWGNWLREEVHYSPSSANNMMRIFDAYGATQMGLFGPEANCQTFGNLEYSKALALLAVPEEDREQFALEVDAAHLSVRQLKAEIKAREQERDEARNQAKGWELKCKAVQDSAAEKIERIRHEADLDRKEQEDANAAAMRYKAECDRRAQETTRLEGRVKSLTEELTIAKQKVEEALNRPTDVAVQTIDASEEQLKAAEEKARTETKAEITRLEAQVKAAEAKAKKAHQEGLKEAQDEVSRLRAKLAEAEQRTDQQAQNAAPADRSVAEINVLFRQVQEAGNRMVSLIDQMDDIHREKMRRVLPKVFRDIAEKLED